MLFNSGERIETSEIKNQNCGRFRRRGEALFQLFNAVHEEQGRRGIGGLRTYDVGYQSFSSFSKESLSES